jgi:hypothetical protein
MDLKSLVGAYFGIMVISAPGTKTLAIAIDDTTQTIFLAGGTRDISHKFFYLHKGIYIHTILSVICWNQPLVRG